MRLRFELQIRFSVRAFLLLALLLGTGGGSYLKWLNERTIRIATR